jgi:eukaryotic-like serine/threonine-protein kinase
VDTVGMTDPAHPRARLDRGVCVGRYVIVRWIGEGGMGVVYEAYDPELERAVALKFLHTSGDPGSSTATGRRDRLFREAKALARLSHPHVLAIYDVGTFGDDVFLATEFVEGPMLATWLKEKKRSRAEVLGALLDAGEGLAAAHRAGLVHRDFKPANVIVGTDGRVRVLDFGLARAEPLAAPSSERSRELTSAPLALERTSASLRELRESPSRSSTPSLSTGLLDLTITQFGEILGTPRFMAPEQHLGLPADARSDQFSFCVSLYDALYGEFPFDGRGDEYAANVTRGHMRNAPAGSDVPSWLRLLLLKGLSLSASERFTSMDELLAALRKDPRVARNRWLAIASSATLLVCAGLALHRAPAALEPPCRGAERKLAGIWDGDRKQAVHAAFTAAGSANAEDAFQRTEAALDDYAHGWVRMHTDACEATQVRGEQSAEILDLRVECLGERLEELRAQVDVFAHANASTVDKSVQAARALARIQACADTTALRAPIRPPSDEPTRARVEALRSVIAKAKAEQRAGNYANAFTLATASADESVALGYRPVEAEALYLLADVQDDQGDYSISERTFRRSFAAALAGRHEAQAARSLSALVVEVGLRQARFAEAHDWAALAEAETEHSSDPFIKGELARDEGRLLVREDRFEEARVEIEKCLSIWEPALGPDDYAIAGPVTDLGNVFLLEGRSEEARAEYSRSIAILEKVLGPDSPSLSPNLNNLGELAIGRGDYDLAAQSLERARALWQKALGPDHPKVALALYNLSITRLELGDAAGSLAMSERALTIWRKALAPDHPDVAMGMHGVAEGLRAKGDFAGALAQEEGALAIREKVYGANGDEVAESLVSIGETRVAEGHAIATAVAPLSRAVGILEKKTGKGLDLAKARFGLARALATSDAGRSRMLASQAKDAYVSAATPLGAKRAEEISAWLARASHT